MFVLMGLRMDGLAPNRPSEQEEGPLCPMPTLENHSASPQMGPGVPDLALTSLQSLVQIVHL